MMPIRKSYAESRDRKPVRRVHWVVVLSAAGASFGLMISKKIATNHPKLQAVIAIVLVPLSIIFAVGIVLFAIGMLLYLLEKMGLIR